LHDRVVAGGIGHDRLPLCTADESSGVLPSAVGCSAVERGWGAVRAVDSVVAACVGIGNSAAGGKRKGREATCYVAGIAWSGFVSELVIAVVRKSDAVHEIDGGG